MLSAIVEPINQVLRQKTFGFINEIKIKLLVIFPNCSKRNRESSPGAAAILIPPLALPLNHLHIKQSELRTCDKLSIC